MAKPLDQDRISAILGSKMTRIKRPTFGQIGAVETLEQASEIRTKQASPAKPDLAVRIVAAPAEPAKED